MFELISLSGLVALGVGYVADEGAGRRTAIGAALYGYVALAVSLSAAAGKVGWWVAGPLAAAMAGLIVWWWRTRDPRDESAARRPTSG